MSRTSKCPPAPEVATRTSARRCDAAWTARVVRARRRPPAHRARRRAADRRRAVRAVVERRALIRRRRRPSVRRDARAHLRGADAARADRLHSCFPRPEFLLARHFQRTFEACDFEARNVETRRRNAVIPPPCVILCRGRPGVELVDEAGIEQALDGGIEGTRGELYLAFGAVTDILDDGVTVQIAVGKRQENLKDRD